MSRWTEEFENHAFQSTWDTLKSHLEGATVDDETILTSVTELARLKKVVTYIDNILHSLDPELVPITTWEAFNQQATPCQQQIDQYVSNRNIAHIQKANTHADNLLSYLRPYMIAEGEAGKMLQEAAKGYANIIDEYGESFRQKSTTLISEISNHANESEKLQGYIKETSDAVDEYFQKLFNSEENAPSIQDKINELVKDFESKYSAIDKFNDKLLEGDESIQYKIDEAEQSILEAKIEIGELLANVNNEVNNLQAFHIKIFGKEVEGKQQGGLSDDLDKRMKVLADFEQKQSTRYTALNKQIEDLIPGATSTGLATAYRQMKRSFDKPIRTYTRVFYASIGVLVFFSIMHTFKFGGEQWIAMVEIGDWDTVFRGLVDKIPFYGPVLWLALFATKRRSEFQRLQQEYAHKEALAKSYKSYKKQIEELDDKDSQMQKDFINKTIDAIAYNASATLDGNHGDKMPVQEIIEKTLDKAIQKLPMPGIS